MKTKQAPNLFPNGHGALQLVDGEMGRLYRLAPVPGRHGDYHAGLADGAASQLMRDGYFFYIPLLSDLEYSFTHQYTSGVKQCTEYTLAHSFSISVSAISLYASYSREITFLSADIYEQP